MRKLFDRYTIIGAFAGLLIFLILAPRGTVAGIIQAVIPQVVPTANKRGNGTVFQIAASSTSAAAGTLLCDDGSGNTTTSGCSTGGTTATITIANDASTGTTLNKLAKLTGAPSTAIIAGASDTGGVVGVVTAGAGTTGNATIQIAGTVSCVFDGATTAGHYVQISGTAGDCHDSGATYPTSGQAVGRVLSTNVGGGTYSMDLFPAEIQPSAGGSVSSVNTQTGAVVTSAVSTYAGLPAASANGKMFLLSDSLYAVRDNGASLDFFGSLLPVTVPPAAGTWTTIIGSGTASSTFGPLYMQPNLTTNAFVILARAQPSTPYTIDTIWDLNLQAGSGTSAAGLAFRESSSSKEVDFDFMDTANPTTQACLNLTSDTTFSAFGCNTTKAITAPMLSSRRHYVRMVNTGSVLRFFSSGDGINWMQYGTDVTESAGGFFSSGPNQIALRCANGDNTNLIAQCTLLSYNPH